MPDLSAVRARARAPRVMRRLLPLRQVFGARGLGAPALFAIGLSAVGASIYFALGVVAQNALGLTPVVFLLAGGFFLLTMMTYVEGGSLHPERGGASALARYAFNELWSFIAGWAILLDYLIVIAIASFSIAHYLAPVWGSTNDAGVEHAIAALAITLVVVLNVRGLPADRLRFVLGIGLLNFVVLFAVMAVGAAEFFDAGELIDSVDLGRTPRWEDAVFAAVVATVALTGIEAASGFANEVRVGGAELKRLVIVGTLVVMTVFVGLSAVAVTGLPPIGDASAVDPRWVEAPILGVVSQLDSEVVRDVFRWVVGGVAALVLFHAANTSMLGLSRLAYSLATNGQIPTGVGKLHREYATPYIAVIGAAVLAFGLVLTSDIEFLAGIFAFGAMLAFAIAHLSIIVLRYREPDAHRAFRVPGSIPVRGRPLPVPAAAGAFVALAAWASVLVFHEGARLIGGIWMAVGLTLYVGYRLGQGKTLSKRYEIPAEALRKAPAVEYGAILVPVFGEEMDDEIIGTAGRLASEQADEGEGGALIEAIYVVEIPMSLPLDARVPEARIADARAALSRAKRVGEEYEDVSVATASVRARTYGQGIVEEARRRGVEAIVLAAEEPTKMRGGRKLGGRGGPRNRSVGETTRYVLEKAPCRVILTAPPIGEEGAREGVAP